MHTHASIFHIQCIMISMLIINRLIEVWIGIVWNYKHSSGRFKHKSKTRKWWTEWSQNADDVIQYLTNQRALLYHVTIHWRVTWRHWPDRLSRSPEIKLWTIDQHRATHSGLPLLSHLGHAGHICLESIILSPFTFEKCSDFSTFTNRYQRQ